MGEERSEEIHLGAVFDLGEQWQIIKFCDEPNAGLCVVQNARGQALRVPVAWLEHGIAARAKYAQLKNELFAALAQVEAGVLMGGAGWTSEWPTEPGHYLFRGWRRSDVSEGRLRLRMVTVALGSEGKVFRATEGEFFYQSEHIGLFKKIDPELPTEEEVRRLAK